jgi:hypothetical protein
MSLMVNNETDFAISSLPLAVEWDSISIRWSLLPFPFILRNLLIPYYLKGEYAKKYCN